MKNGKFLFFGIVLGACFVQSAFAMELVTRDDQKDDVALNMQYLRSDKYNRSISQIKGLNLETVRSALEDEQFLPAHSDELQHLLYLSTLNKNNTIQTPFTLNQQNKFDTAYQIKKFVPLWFKINAVAIPCTSFFSFTNLVSLAQCSNVTQSWCLSPTATTMTSTVIGIIGVCAVGYVALYATGLSPHRSARKADNVQDQIGYLKDKYATIAKYWIDIYFDCPEKAQFIADNFDIDALKMRIQLKTHKKKSGESLVSCFEEVWHYIKYKSILTKFTDIETYIYHKIDSGKIELLTVELDLLKKIMLKQKEEIDTLKNKKDI